MIKFKTILMAGIMILPGLMHAFPPAPHHTFFGMVRDELGRPLEGEKVEESQERARRGVWEVFEKIGAEKRVEATALQTVGPKGWDGFAIALVVE